MSADQDNDYDFASHLIQADKAKKSGPSGKSEETSRVVNIQSSPSAAPSPKSAGPSQEKPKREK